MVDVADATVLVGERESYNGSDVMTGHNHKVNYTGCDRYNQSLALIGGKQ